MSSKALLKVLILLVVGAGITLAVIYREAVNIEAIRGWVESAGYFGPAAFMALYAVSTVLFLPGSALTLAGGALFGPIWGTVYNLSGATMGATLAFLVARYVASDWVANRSGKVVEKLVDGVAEEGWRFVALARLVPIFPFNVLNYALGLTKIPLIQYVLASFIFIAPGTFAYTYAGYAAGQAVGGAEGILPKAVAALAILAVVSYIPRIIKKLRKSSDGEDVSTPEVATE